MNDFIQTAPVISNTWQSDHLLRTYLERVLPPEHFAAIAADLERFGERAVTDLAALAAEAEANPPYLVNFDAWGNRIDKVVTHPAWQALDKVSAEEGIVAIGYERDYGRWSRVYQLAKLYLFHPSSAFYTCPLAMTDGAAKLIETYGDNELSARVMDRLTSRDPYRFWTSGQWMTEKTGGSDVGETETRAKFEQGAWRLYGTKWFTSAVTSQMAMTLARVVDTNGEVLRGSRGLSLFYVELKDAHGHHNRLQIVNLKDKLGTRALPTAELALMGTPAQRVAKPGEGVKTISTLFNVTRIYNACTTMGAWRRLLDLAIDYATKREAFKKPLARHPLHLRTLGDLEIRFQACFHLVMYVAELLGITETGEGGAEQAALLRLLTPIAKSWCAKQNLIATTELVESFGGAGYLEDTGIPKWLRDNQVLTIWEGTTNVLSLDVLRAIDRDKALPCYVADVRQRLEPLTATPARQQVLDALHRLEQGAGELWQQARDTQEYAARELAFSLANILSASLMLAHADACPQDSRAAYAAQQFCNRPLYTLAPASADEIAARHAFLFDGPS